MADAEQQETSQEIQSTETVQAPGTNKVETELASVKAMLEQMNASFAAAAAAQAAAKPAPKVEIPDPTYDPAGYAAYVAAQAGQAADVRIEKERQLQATISDLYNKYPEISSDAELKRSITAAQARLPKELRDTAAGYKAAILEAVSDAGLVPKSKRQAQLDEDVSLGAGRGAGASPQSARSKAKTKVSEETLAIAQLLGRDINDPKVLAGLEKATKRNKWSSWE